jgi:hypothetical protein
MKNNPLLQGESKNLLNIFENLLQNQQSWVKGIQNQRQGPFQREDNHKIAKMAWVHFKIFSRTTEPE